MPVENERKFLVTHDGWRNSAPGGGRVRRPERRPHIIAEVEPSHPEQSVVLPDWIGEEVTSDERYRNSHRADAPRAAPRASD